MLTIRDLLKEIYEIDENVAFQYAKEKYSHIIPEKVLEYFVCRHCSQYYDMEEFNQIDLLNCKFNKIRISSKEVFTKLEYADFCTFRNEEKSAFEGLCDVGYNYWPNGTWSAPILTTQKGDKYVVIDGNNRLRMLRMFLRYSNKHKSNYHEIVNIESK